MLPPLKRAKKCGEAAGVHNPLEETGSQGQKQREFSCSRTHGLFFFNLFTYLSEREREKE